MFKKVLAIIAVPALFIACGGQKQQAGSTEEANPEPVMVTVAEFNSKAGDIIGRTVIIEGIVNHVCKHGGKKMFLVDEKTDESVKVVVGDNIPSFNTDLEGSDVVVKGMVEELRIDNAYLDEWENELVMQSKEGDDDDDEGEMEEGEEDEAGDIDQDDQEDVEMAGHDGTQMGEKADKGEHIDGMENITSLREELKASGKDHLSFYSIVCQEFEVKSKTADSTAVKEE